MNLKDWINLKYLENKNIENLKLEFNSTIQFSHISINDFFLESKLIEIQNELKSENYYLEETDLYQFYRTIDFKNSTNKKILEFRNFLMSDDFINYIEQITNLKLIKNKIDLHSLKLQNTNYLLCHDDRVENRKIAFIINFSNFKEEDGGILELIEIDKENNGKIFKRIIPKFNKFNMFEVTDNSYHQISEVISNKDRITIGGWYSGK